MSTPGNLKFFSVANGDMQALLGEPSFCDAEFLDGFLATFSPLRTEGVEGNQSAASIGFSLAIKLTFSANITCFAKIPDDTSQGALPPDTTTVPFSKVLKFPIGALESLYSNLTFKSKLCMYVYEGQKAAMFAAGPKKCNCCGSLADGFVTAMEVIHAKTESTETFLEGSTIIRTDPCFPVCQKTECNRRLRELADSLTETDGSDHITTCANCHKAEEPDTTVESKFKKCSRCKMRHYCSRSCQKEDWPYHKKMCKKEHK